VPVPVPVPLPEILNEMVGKMNDLVAIYQTYDSLKTQLIESLLSSENILCYCKTNDASGVLPHLRMSQGGIQIFVREEDQENALAIIHEEIS
jgi:Putative prokaryotic signal transducing protein